MASAELYPVTGPQRVDDSFDRDPRSNRRIHERLKASELEWLRSASVKYGADVRVLDISAGGLLLNTQQLLKPNASIVLELDGPDGRILVPSKVLRCRVASLTDILEYEGACAFKRPLFIPELTVKHTSDTTEPGMALEHAAETNVRRKVVARLNDGRIVRGYTNDFNPLKAQLHVSSDRGQGQSTIISLSELKALFFVRDSVDDPTRAEAKFIARCRTARGCK